MSDSIHVRIDAKFVFAGVDLSAFAIALATLALIVERDSPDCQISLPKVVVELQTVWSWQSRLFIISHKACRNGSP